jgi:hypothetical protein
MTRRCFTGAGFVTALVVSGLEVQPAGDETAVIEYSPASVALLRIAARSNIGLSTALLMSSVVWPMDPPTTKAVALAGIAVLIGGPILVALAARAVAGRPRRLFLQARTCRLGERLVIVRAPGDEAALVLAASALVERIGRLGTDALQRVVVALALIGLVMMAMTLGIVALIAFGASSWLGRPELLGGMRWGDVVPQIALLEGRDSPRRRAWLWRLRRRRSWRCSWGVWRSAWTPVGSRPGS